MKTEEERFFEKVLKTGSCWIWTGAKNGDGYGVFYVEGRYRVASNYALEHFVTPSPVPGLLCLHSCDNPSCVNYEAHLSWGTQSENMQQARDRARLKNLKLSHSDVSEIKFLYSSGGWSQRALASMFGCTQRNISYVVRGNTWAPVAA